MNARVGLHIDPSFVAGPLGHMLSKGPSVPGQWNGPPSDGVGQEPRLSLKMLKTGNNSKTKGMCFFVMGLPPDLFSKHFVCFPHHVILYYLRRDGRETALHTAVVMQCSSSSWSHVTKRGKLGPASHHWPAPTRGSPTTFCAVIGEPNHQRTAERLKSMAND